MTHLVHLRFADDVTMGSAMHYGTQTTNDYIVKPDPYKWWKRFMRVTCISNSVIIMPMNKLNQKCATVSEISNAFENMGGGCVSQNFELNGQYNLYVEINLSGCRHLCMFLHNSTCTMVMFLPNARSCLLLALQNISFADKYTGCRKVELYRRNRQKGNSLTVHLLW